MKYFRYDAEGPEVHLYPLVCWHIGAKQSSTKFIEKVIGEIQADPLARWIYMGDAGECVTKASKGNIYEQLLNPGDQLRVAAEYLMPIKDKGLFGIRGNHGNRIDKETGVGWDEMLCARVGIPYMGVSALASVVLLRESTAKLGASVFVHHGSASAITPAGKMAAAHKPEKFIHADVIITAHTHACGEAWPPKHFAYADAFQRRIRWYTQRLFVAGSAYDSRSGYAEEKLYEPILPEHLAITMKAVRPMRDGKRYLQLEVSHRKIQGFDEEFINPEELDKWSEPSFDEEEL